MGDTILEMKHVTKKFPGVIALNDVSIDVKKRRDSGNRRRKRRRKIYSDEGIKRKLYQ